MRRVSVLLLVVAAAFHLGVSAPQKSSSQTTAGKEKTSSSAGTPSSSVVKGTAALAVKKDVKAAVKTVRADSGKTVMSAMTPQSVGSQIVRQFAARGSGKTKAGTGEKMTGSSAAGSGTGKGGVPQASVIPIAKIVKPLPKPVKATYVVPPPVPRVQVPQIRQEIQKVLELNKKIQSVQSGRVGQVQRIQEQARIHQRILDAIEASQKKGSPNTAPQKSDLLSQEKLRIIHEETQRNEKMIQEIKNKSAAAEQTSPESSATKKAQA
ncbi:MAG TPA: hypothetical protein PLL75_05070 [Candidatus Omnitrophota bacterium]|nr:hypothetical protein [Candidatus Omnitrophota bacterium]HPS37080.1 hypothetical protein [Candidatus Omnitrophota bacterium]